MVKCCSKARTRMKLKATRTARRKAAHGVTPKKAAGKKAHAKKGHAKKATPCRICGKGR